MSYLGIFYFSEPKIKNIKFVSAERGITNELNEENSIFKTGRGNWFFSESYDPSSGWDSSVSIDRNGGSLKVIGKYDGTSNVLRCKVSIPTITAGEFFTLRAYYKPVGIIEKPLKEEENFQFLRIRTSFFRGASDTFQYFFSGLSALKNGWYLATVWGKAVESYTNGIISLRFDLLDFPTDRYGEIVVYIDCVQLVKSTDIQYSGTFQPGGTPRADEILIAPAY